MPNTFKSNWVDYIENEFDRREYGHWFINNGKPDVCYGRPLYVFAVDEYRRWVP